MSRQKVMRFEQPDQFRGPFPALLHLPGISEGKAFARAWLGADRSTEDSFPDWAPPALRLADDLLRIAAGLTRFSCSRNLDRQLLDRNDIL